MSAEEVEGAGRPFIGFHTFADDTPRDLPEQAHRPQRLESSTASPDDLADSAAGQDLILQSADRPSPMRGRRRGNGLWATLLAVALVGGSVLAFGLGVERQRRTDTPLALSTPSATMQIRVAPASQPLAMAVIGAPEPIDGHASAGPPQTLAGSPSSGPSPASKTSAAPDRLAALAAEFPVAHGEAGPPAPVAASVRAPTVTATPSLPDVPPRQSSAAPPDVTPGQQAAEIVPPPERSSPEESCRYAHSRAELMVCNDPELEAEDRQVTEAYRAAIAAGAPEGRLAREQRDWLNAREDASRRSRREVQSLYALRLDDLAQWLDDDPVGTRR